MISFANLLVSHTCYFITGQYKDCTIFTGKIREIISGKILYFFLKLGELFAHFEKNMGKFVEKYKIFPWFFPVFTVLILVNCMDSVAYSKVQHHETYYSEKDCICTKIMFRDCSLKRPEEKVLLGSAGSGAGVLLRVVGIWFRFSLYIILCLAVCCLTFSRLKITKPMDVISESIKSSPL